MPDILGGVQASVLGGALSTFVTDQVSGNMQNFKYDILGGTIGAGLGQIGYQGTTSLGVSSIVVHDKGCVPVKYWTRFGSDLLLNSASAMVQQVVSAIGGNQGAGFDTNFGRQLLIGFLPSVIEGWGNDITFPSRSDK